MENSSLNNLPPFYVGEKVVAISYGRVSGRKIGKVYVVKAIKKMSCGCYLINVGFSTPNGLIECPQHNTTIESDNVHWQSVSEYRPIKHQNFPLISLSKVIEKEKQLVCAN